MDKKKPPGWAERNRVSPLELVKVGYLASILWVLRFGESESVLSVITWAIIIIALLWPNRG